MKKSICILILIITICVHCSNNNNDKILKAKKTVQKAFCLASKDNFDSLKILMPIVANDPNDYLRIEFSAMKKVFLTEGQPALEDLQSYTFKESDINICSIKYIPKLAKESRVDSITFTFDKYKGLDRISTFECFEQIPILQPIAPNK